MAYRLGSDRVCPICGFEGRRFLGYAGRSDARCPSCGSLERHRLLWAYLDTLSGFHDESRRILYLAPKACIVDELTAHGHRVITADLQMDDVDARSDITRLPFADGVFDTILCLHVLEHVPDDRSAMAEMHRTLDDHGAAFVMVPKDLNRATTYEDASITTAAGRAEAFGQEDHVRRYGRDFVARLTAAGFDVSIEPDRKLLSSDTVERFGLLRREGAPIESIHRCLPLSA